MRRVVERLELSWRAVSLCSWYWWRGGLGCRVDEVGATSTDQGVWWRQRAARAAGILLPSCSLCSDTGHPTAHTSLSFPSPRRRSHASECPVAIGRAGFLSTFHCVLGRATSVSASWEGAPHHHLGGAGPVGERHDRGDNGEQRRGGLEPPQPPQGNALRRCAVPRTHRALAHLFHLRMGQILSILRLPVISDKLSLITGRGEE